ncbi:MAG: DUF4136 domain-containing protein [Xanthomonadales bacterium]|jgi:hypothetical protein|nr:DUF4136 domain-containing protein [Xanthomonadales bacterium]
MNRRCEHRPVTRGFLLLGCLWLAGCAPYQPKIDVIEDSAKPVTAYATWNFVDPMTVESTGYPEAVVSSFERNIEAAMAARGYLRSMEPELLVNVAAALAVEVDASLQSDAYQAIHVQRGTFHDSWRGYGEGFGASTRQQRYGDGSISIGLVAAGPNELVWEAVASGRLSGQRSDEAMIEMIDSVTRQMLERLPAR